VISAPKEVTVIQRGSHILGGIDPEACDSLADALRADGIRIFTGTRLARIERSQRRTHVVFEQDGREQIVEAAELLNALGRRPALHGIAGAGLSTRDGRIAVTPDQRTSHPHIFAAGDVCGPNDVVHEAILQGEIAARNAARHLGRLDGPDEKVDDRLGLFAVFTEPAFALAGTSESELRRRGVAFRSASYPFADHGKSLVMGEPHGFVKLLTEASTGEILGASVVGPDASEIIHEIVVAMRFRATAAQLASTPHYHPTLSEIWTYPAEELAGL